MVQHNRRLVYLAALTLDRIQLSAGECNMGLFWQQVKEDLGVLVGKNGSASKAASWFAGECCIDDDDKDEYQILTSPARWRKLQVQESGEQVDRGVSTILAAKLRASVELVIHEDRLNWQKFYNLVYTQAFLVGGFLMVSHHHHVSHWGWLVVYIQLSIGLTGVLFTLLFAITLWSGVSCLRCHKAAVVSVDKAIAGLEHLVNGSVEFNEPCEDNPPGTVFFAKEGPTRILLRYGPLVILLMWACLIAIALASGYMSEGSSHSQQASLVEKSSLSSYRPQGN